MKLISELANFILDEIKTGALTTHNITINKGTDLLVRKEELRRDSLHHCGNVIISRTLSYYGNIPFIVLSCIVLF